MKVCLKTCLRRSPGLNSFSLVEVVFAIAIVSFALVSILGLMAYSSQLVHQADNYARLSNVTRQVLARLDSQSYSINSAAINANTNFCYYFTYDGIPTNSAAGYYQCLLTNASPTGTPSSLMQVQVIIKWPLPAPTSTNWVNTSILNYD